ncbi:Protein NUCLEAR FUSION DEFECTIVE 4 [Linum grandiflorum]
MAIIFVATTCGVGGALMAIDNLAQIAESLGYKNRTISTFISLISIWNFLGRVLLAGLVSEILLTRHLYSHILSNKKMTVGEGCLPAKNFPRQVITGRWFMFFAALLIEAGSGASYIFGIYSHDIKSSLGYDQSTLNLLGFFKDLGGNLGVLSGLLNEVSPPWVILLIGAIMNFGGYFMIWLAVVGKIPKPPVWQMCIYICVGANSQAFANTGALVTCVKNFPGSRGAVLGLLKGMVGLSGAIFTLFYRAFYGDDSKSLILFIGLLPTFISFVFLRTIRPMKNTNSRETEELEIRVLYRILYSLLSLAGLLMTLIIVQNVFRFTRPAYLGSASPVLLLLFVPLAVVIKEEYDILQQRRSNQMAAGLAANEAPPPSRPLELIGPKSESAPTDESSASCTSDVFSPPARGNDYTILQTLFSIDMLILFGASICGVGGTLTAVDNLGQIGHSLGYPKQSVSTAISLISIWSFLGRVVSGFCSEILLTKYKIPRPLFFAVVIFTPSAGYLLIAFAVPYSIYIASIIIGFCFGAQFTLLFAMISEIFGLKYYATLYNFGAVASPVGSYIMNVVVAGKLYDREATRQMAEEGLTRKAGEELTCNGATCFKPAFLIIVGLTLFGTAISLWLVARTWKFYQGDIYGRFRDDGAVGSGAVGDDGGGDCEMKENGGR